MIDFEDIGGIYDSTAAAAANVAAFNAFMSSVPSPTLRFGGPKTATYGNKRLPGRAYFNDTITIPSGKPVHLDGGNSRLSWTTISDVKPGLVIETGAASIRRLIENFDADSTGSGLLLQTPGKGTLLRNISFNHPSGLGSACTGASTGVELDDFSDLDLASYAFKIEDSDGFTMEDCSALTPQEYGILVKGRLQDGVIRARLWGSLAAHGFKGENINGSIIDLVTEAHYGFGYAFSRCGIPVVNASNVAHLTNDRNNRFDIWVEACGGRGNTITGHDIRQGWIDKCGAVRLFGYNGWGSNKIKIDEGSRASCYIVSDVHLENSVSPSLFDLNNENPSVPDYTFPEDTSDVRNNNFDAVWASGAPSVTSLGTQGTTGWLISFPANSFQGLTGTAYWRPWGLIDNYEQQAGDNYRYEMEIEGSQEAVDWCLANDTLNSTLLTINFAPYSGPSGAGTKHVGLYTRRSRKVLARIAVETGKAEGNDVNATPAFSWGSSTPNNTSAMTLTIKSLEVVGTRTDGTAVQRQDIPDQNADAHWDATDNTKVFVRTASVFSGVEHIQVDSTPTVTGLGFAHSIWFKAAHGIPTGGLTYLGLGGANTEYFGLDTNVNVLRAIQRTAAGGTNNVNAGTYIADAWNFGVANFGAVNLGVSLNGQAFSTIPAIAFGATPDRMGIGATARASPLYPFSGSLQGGAFWNRELTLAEVQWLYNGNVPRTLDEIANSLDPDNPGLAALWAYYHLGDDSPGPYMDSIATRHMSGVNGAPVPGDGHIQVNGAAAVGGVVYRVDDETPNGWNLFSTAFNTRGVLGAEGILLDSVDDFLETVQTGLHAMPASFFAVVEFSSPADGQTRDVIGMGDADLSQLRSGKTAPGNAYFADGGVQLTTGVATAGKHCIAVQFNGAASQLAIDRASPVVGNTGTESADGSIRVGADFAKVGGGDFRFSEGKVFFNEISSSQFDAERLALCDKYSIP